MRNHKVFTLWLLMIRERVKEGKVPHLKKDNKLSIKKNDNKDTCFFCKKGGHMKKDCQKYKRWLEKKGNIISLVCHESFFVEAPCNTWKPASNEQPVYFGNKLFSHVEAVGTFRLILKTGYVLDLENVFFIPCFSRNLISVSKLDVIGFGFLFINSTFSVFKGENFIGGGTKVDGLFKIDLYSNFENNHLSLHSSVGTKRSLVNENSVLLWHRRL
jgi:hypothetical protein